MNALRRFFVWIVPGLAPQIIDILAIVLKPRMRQIIIKRFEFADVRVSTYKAVRATYEAQMTTSTIYIYIVILQVHTSYKIVYNEHFCSLAGHL